MDELKLTQDYLLILEQCHDPDVKFSESPVEKEFANLWLLKLCSEIYRGVEAKRLRNLYLVELSKCIDDKVLSKIFMQTPPTGPLPPFESDFDVKVDRKGFVQEMLNAATKSFPGTTRNPGTYQTHMSTKIFDDNRGACAYLAVSLGDPKQGPLWMQMGGKDIFKQNCQSSSQETETSGEEEPVSRVNVRFGQFCLNAIANELSGFGSPNDCPVLEKQLEKYSNFIKGTPVGDEAKSLNGIRLRTFLLLNFQTDLLRALEARRQIFK